jgi:molybdopterin converting factor small subunit
MSIRVLFFGSTAAITGNREIEMTGFHGVWIRELFAHLINKYPELASHRLLLALNQQYSKGEEIIRDGDEVAVFTAVSGG